jgi:hypothetical protein
MYRPLFTGLCALGLFATQASAQRYSIRKPPAILDEISIGATFVSPCDVAFENLGNIMSLYNEAGKYNDAIVEQDSTAGTPAADGKTYNFAYNSLLQLSDSKGNPNYKGEYLKATAVKAEATDGTFSETGDSGYMQGMDVTYTHYFTRKHSFGLTVGVGNNGFAFRRSRDWDVTVTARSDLYRAEGLEGLSNFRGNQERPRVFSDSEPEAYVYYDNPIHLGEEQLGTDINANGVWDLRAAYMNFRFGATYNIMMSRHFIMRMSGGFSLVSASSRFRWSEKFTAPLSSITSDVTSSGVSYKHKFLVGGWADIGAHYRISRVMTVYSSLQYQATGTLEQKTSVGHVIKLDSGSLYSMKTGFAWSF